MADSDLPWDIDSNPNGKPHIIKRREQIKEVNPNKLSKVPNTMYSSN